MLRPRLLYPVIVLVLACFLGVNQATAQAMTEPAAFGHTTSPIITLLEIPFLLLCIYFAFSTANALKGGIFGVGMNLLAWGFLVMAVGHIHMQLEHYLGISLFSSLFGRTGGAIAWVIALAITWGLSGVGFYKIYDASKSA